MTRRQFPTDPLDRALLEAVLRAPDDDGPRLVYADRLIERGDPRGELIVVQCTCARLEREGRTDSDEYKVAKLRESTILPKLERAWAQDFGGESWRGHVTRGFFTRLDLPWSVLRFRWRLFSAHPLEEVIFDNYYPDHRDGMTLGAFATLSKKPTIQRLRRLTMYALNGAIELDPSKLRLLLNGIGRGDPTPSWLHGDEPHPRLRPVIREVRLGVTWWGENR